MTTTDISQAVEEIEIAAWTDLLRAATPAQAAQCGVGWHGFSHGVASIVSSTDVLAFNRVIGFGSAGAVSDDELERLIEFYAEAGVGRAFVQVNPVSADPSVFEALTNRGLRHYNNWVKLYRDTSALPPVATDLRTELIGRESAAEFAAITASAFDWPEHVQPWIAQLVGRRGWRHYMAFADGQGVATAALYISGAWGWIDFAATVESYRGRGAQGKLLEMRIADAALAGCRFIAVETAEQTAQKDAPSYRNMRRYGFQEAFVRPNYLWTAAP